MAECIVSKVSKLNDRTAESCVECDFMIWKTWYLESVFSEAHFTKLIKGASFCQSPAASRSVGRSVSQLVSQSDSQSVNQLVSL